MPELEIEYKLLLKEASKSLFLNLDKLIIKQGYFNLNKSTFTIDDKKTLVINNGLFVKKIPLKDDILNKISPMFSLVNDVLTLTGEKPAVRIRETINVDLSSHYDITFKSKKSKIERFEESIAVSSNDSIALFEMTKNSTLYKERFLIPVENGLFWEVDFFTGRNNGLVVAEIEVPDKSYPMPKPPEDWVYDDITFNNDFSNHSLAFIPHRLMGDGSYNSDHSCLLKS